MKLNALVSRRSLLATLGSRLSVMVAIATTLAGSHALAATSQSSTPQEPPLAFPDAVGWAAHTPGGRGGQLIRVTTLAGDGPGSFAEAVMAKGPRIVVFEVGGVIDLGARSLTITEPFLTIAGQTAPSPGVTLIRGGLAVLTHDVIVQHLRIRPGEAGKPKHSGWEPDALTTGAGAHDVIVDHCSLTWAIDENLSASGPRFGGETPAQWREATSHRITFSNNLIAEGLARATHSKGEHSKGSLIHDNAEDILIIGNLYAHNAERNALFKGAARGLMINNLIYDPGARAIHYNLISQEWLGQPYQPGYLGVINNVLRTGPSTPNDIAFIQFGGSGPLQLYTAGNIAVDRLGNPLPMEGRYSTSAAGIEHVPTPPRLPTGVKIIPTVEVQDYVLRNVGARPWERDAIDSRIVADTIEGRGEIIDSEQQVGGYPRVEPTQARFDPREWDLFYMVHKH